MAYQLLIGFDENTPPEQAAATAISRWHDAVARDGGQATAEPTTRFVRTEERTAVGEYAVEVTGQRTLAGASTPFGSVVVEGGAGAGDQVGGGDGRDAGSVGGGGRGDV